MLPSAVQIHSGFISPVSVLVHNQTFSPKNVKADSIKVSAFTLTRKKGGKIAVVDMINPAAML